MGLYDEPSQFEVIETENLLQKLTESASTSPIFSGRGRFVVDETLGCALLFAAKYQEDPENYVIVANNLFSAEKIYNFLLNFLSEDQLLFFPNDELLRAESLSSGRELLSQRLYALGKLQNEKSKKIVICHPASLLRFLPDPKRFKEETLLFKIGDSYDLVSLKTHLIEMGYQAINKVEHSLQFASRGDILDIYSVSYLDPIRIEFFGDEIESIRVFNVSSQQTKEELKEALILPASDIFLNDDELSDFTTRLNEEMEKNLKLLPSDVGETLKQNISIDLESFISHDYRNNLYKYYGFALNRSFSLLSYFKPRLVYFCSKESFKTNSEMLIREAESHFLDLRIKGRITSGLREYMNPSEAMPEEYIYKGSEKFSKSLEDYQFIVRPPVIGGRNINSLLPSLQAYLNTGNKIVLSLPLKQQKDLVVSLLKENKIDFELLDGLDLPTKQLGITSFAFNEGFDLPSFQLTYFSSNEIFGHKSSSSRFTSRFKDATILRSYEDLNPGDYVVHEYNGIGQFLGIKTIESEGIHRDYLYIAYAGNEFLYVPLEQFRLVRKYAGREGAAPKLSKLSGGDWEKRKSKIKERINELADKLLALYGDRAKNEGFAFPKDDDLQLAFENEFPYELTDDQQKSLQEIKEDMEKPEIMDRLLCGDVGFGKTEIAFRAAFKAISAGKQVAILTPTTILCRQHYEVAQSRFLNYGVRIAMMSRLVPNGEQKKIIEELKEGTIDLVIGTHRLLSKEIEYKNLGLLIVDEEQRFGVEQKEKIKEIKRNVDVLTLSATPIPRTLQMSLVGIRALSQINTAPIGRMPIQTYVVPYEASVVAELIQKELARNGQVFYIHNKVATIYNTAYKIESSCRGAKIGVVHGQMEKEEVEDVMSQFYDGEINVLVATSIVESGIDVPNANMIIVEDADHFGLSQLYQIKGRVGRGDRIAYAYLMYKPNRSMNEDAEKRLKAIQEFTELGSGYKIAQRDLMIRGAGDILGPEQAGFIDSIGLDLYLKMLNEAVENKKEGKVAEPPKPNKLLKIDAYIPQEYAINSDKIQLYQELDDLKSESEVDAYYKKVKDIYGEVPESTRLLIKKRKMDILLSNVEFESLHELDERVDISMSDEFTKINGIGNDLFNALIEYLYMVKVSFVNRKLVIRVEKKKDWFNQLENIIKTIHKLYCNRVTQR